MIDHELGVYIVMNTQGVTQYSIINQGFQNKEMNLNFETNN